MTPEAKKRQDATYVRRRVFVKRTIATVLGPRASGRLLVALVGLSLLVATQTARAHQDGADNDGSCSGVGVGIVILPFRADGTTPLGSGSVSNCETLVVKSTVNYQHQNTCAFESGMLTLTTPDGMPHTIASNVPCVGGSANDPNSTTLNSGRGLCAGSPAFFPPSQAGISYNVSQGPILGPF